ncbi:MAG: cryptochrome/photolyase family protein [Pseudomonadota bacterium]
MSDARLILVLGDQLSHGLASIAAGDPARDVIVMGEVMAEATYVRHHRKKLVFIFSAMRHFAEELRAGGWRVDYTQLDAAQGRRSFTELVRDAVTRHRAKRVCVVEPGEHRVAEEFNTWPEALGVDLEILEDDRFLCSRSEFTHWADERKSLRMEYFYRDMRRKTGLLMDGDAPAEGKWNFDAENRKAAPADLKFPAPIGFAPDRMTKEVIALVTATFPDGFGDIEPFDFAVTSEEAERALDDFIENRLPLFGDYQDAMNTGEHFMAHSLLSLYMNAGLLDPLYACAKAETAYREGAAPINAVEGFIRQIIGWREFVRGVYWREGPGYVNRDYLGADIPLPAFYWTGETDMACVRAVVDQTIEEAYAHHIQRLMVTGTFALIAGVRPFDVHEWYLAVYADAYEWVEAPNVIGMALFADGGVVASKPYAASGAYINRMSDYCETCAYSPKRKTEPDACPFNALYWDFLIRNESKLKGNPRVSRAYHTWRRMADQVRAAYLQRANELRSRLRAGERI